MRRQLLHVWLLVGVALGCVERSRAGLGPAEPPVDSTWDNTGARIPDVTRDQDVFLITEALRYRLRRESTAFAVDIPYTYRNPRPRQVYLPACRADSTPLPPLLQKEMTPGKWARAWAPDGRKCLYNLLLPMVLQSGQVVAETLHVRALYARDSITSFLVEPPQGVYRLVWRVLESYDPDVLDLGPALPVEQRSSNRFVLDPP